MAVSACALTVSVPAFATDYVQMPGSSLTFATHYQGEVFTGHFSGFATRLRFDPSQLAEAQLDVTIALATASTANDDRDETLRGPDFLDAGRLAQAHYHARSFRHLGGNRYTADGTLRLRGTSRPVTFTFTWTPGAQPVLRGNASVQRLDFGVGGGDWADLALIPNPVAISTRVVLAPATP